MTWLDRIRRAVAGDAEGSAIVAASAHVPDLSRRRFLGLALGAAAVAATIDIEQLLWTPGKTFLLPGEPEFDEFVITGYDVNDPITRPVGDTIQVRLPQRYIHNVAEKRLNARRVA